MGKYKIGCEKCGVLVVDTNYLATFEYWKKYYLKKRCLRCGNFYEVIKGCGKWANMSL